MPGQFPPYHVPLKLSVTVLLCIQDLTYDMAGIPVQLLFLPVQIFRRGLLVLQGIPHASQVLLYRSTGIIAY